MNTPKFIQIACSEAISEELHTEKLYALDEDGGVWFFSSSARRWDPLPKDRRDAPTKSGPKPAKGEKPAPVKTVDARHLTIPMEPTAEVGPDNVPPKPTPFVLANADEVMVFLEHADPAPAPTPQEAVAVERMSDAAVDAGAADVLSEFARMEF